MDIDLDRVLDALPAMVWTAQPDGHIDFVNRRWSEFTGLSLVDAHGWDWQAAVNADDLPQLLEHWRSILASGVPGEMEARVRRFDGEYRWFLVQCSPMHDDTGRIVGWCGVATDVDEFRRAQEALRRRELDFQLIVDSMPAPVAVTTPTGEVEGLNQLTLDYFGKTFEELQDWKVSDVVHPDDLEQTVVAQLSAHQEGTSYNVENRHRRADGVYRWHNVRGFPLRDPQGHIVRWFHLLIDVDDRRRAEDALRESERSSRLIVDSIPGQVAVLAPDGEVELVNNQVLDFYGKTLEELKHWATSDAVHPEDHPRVVETFTRSIASGEPFEAELRARRFDGVHRWFQSRGFPLQDSGGRIVRWYNLLIDIDERKRAETRLANEKQLMEMIAAGRALRDVLSALCKMIEEDAPDCYCDVHPIDWSGPSFEFGVAPSLPAGYADPIAGLPVDGAIIPCGIAARQKIQVIAEDIESDLRWRTSPVRAHALEHGLRAVWSTPICSKEGHVLGTFCVYQRKPAAPTPDHQSLIAHATQIASIAIGRARTEAALRRSETLLAEGQRLSQTGSFSWRTDTDEVLFSNELRRIFEIDSNAHLNIELILSRVHPLDVPLVHEKIAHARSGGSELEYEVRLQMPDGRVKQLHTFAHSVVSVDGRREVLGAMLDITERRHSEEALDKLRADLAHLTRVASLGVLTASIAHEINQPLAGIVTNASTCLRMLAADMPNLDGARATAQRTLRDANRASDVIQHLRSMFARKGPMTARLDLNEAAGEVIRLTRDDLRRGRVVVRTEFTGHLPQVVGDRVQIQQVIMNLLRNGAEAMSETNDRPRQLVVGTLLDDEGYVQLSVKDTGVGFQPQEAERLFQAFFTTKRDGMGVGLSVSRSIIESHGGRLWAGSNEGQGATFAFALPAQSGALAPADGRGNVDAATLDPTQSAVPTVEAGDIA
jgi:PAS domain S-box-containing protein